MAFLVGEPHDLVLERRTVARPDARDLAVVERRVGECCRAPGRARGRSCTRDGTRSGRAQSRRSRTRRARWGRRHARRESREKSMVRRSSRGGVPVFSRPCRTRGLAAIRPASASAARPPAPPGRCSSPTCTRPFRNVPVVTTSARQPTASPSSNARPATRPRSRRTRPAPPKSHVRFGSRRQAPPASTSVAPLVRLRARRPHGRSPTAVEQLELDAGRVDRAPHEPPSASISRTRWPFAVPPIAGLHGISATVSLESVHSPTRAPEAGRRPRGLAPGVTGADDDDVEIGPAFDDRDRGARNAVPYFPTQKRAKMCRSKSSGVRRPVISSSARARRQLGEHEFLGRAARHGARRARERRRAGVDHASAARS